MPTTILLLIDGVSADTVANHPHDLPTLHGLAQQGLRVERLEPDVPATSLAGRVGMLTGVPPARHGVYGNLIADQGRFRYASPEDIRVPTVAGRAKAAGLQVASVGYAMMPPADAHAYRRAWWVSEMIQRGRDAEPVPAGDAWQRIIHGDDPDGSFGALARAGWPEGVIDPYGGDRLQYLVSALEGDRRNLRWTAAMAASDAPPDLIVTEILTPDGVQHAAGQDSPFSLWSIAAADALVATLIADLERARRSDDVHLLLASDHGHGAVATALYAERILPEHATSGEGAILYVAVASDDDRREVTERLAEHDVQPLDAEPFPSDVAAELAAFVAPEGVAFETATPDVPEGATSGTPMFPSTHGAIPGTPSDDRFLIATGPNVPHRRVARAGPADVEATLAAMLGLEPGGIGRSLLHD